MKRDFWLSVAVLLYLCNLIGWVVYCAYRLWSHT